MLISKIEVLLCSTCNFSGYIMVVLLITFINDNNIQLVAYINNSKINLIK